MNVKVTYEIVCEDDVELVDADAALDSLEAAADPAPSTVVTRSQDGMTRTLVVEGPPQ